jgi:hypothetical protein
LSVADRHSAGCTGIHGKPLPNAGRPALPSRASKPVAAIPDRMSIDAPAVRRGQWRASLVALKKENPHGQQEHDLPLV